MSSGSLSGPGEGIRRSTRITSNTACEREYREAQAALSRLGFCVESENLSMERLAGIVANFTVTEKLPKKVADGLKATARVMEAMAKINVTKDVMEVIENGLEAPLREMKRLMEQTREWSMRTEQVVQVVNDVGREVTMAKLDITRASQLQAETYAQVTKAVTTAQPSVEQAAAIARQEFRSRQVIVRVKDGFTENGVKGLTEKEIVEKANMALEMMGTEAGEPPDGTRFLGAKRNPNGSCTLVMSTIEARRWLQETGVLDAFMARFDGSSTATTPMFTVIAEYVPIDFDPTLANAKKDIEEAGGLSRGSIHRAAFLKNADRRTPGQTVGHMIIETKDIAAANRMLQDGLFLAGKWVTVRKEIKEPTRCYKCHRMEDGHFAANCRETKETCGYCGKDHRSSQCPNPDERWCAICRTAGHGAGDRVCQYRVRKMAEWRRIDPEAAHKYFVDRRDPLTWEEVKELGSEGRRMRRDRQVDMEDGEVGWTKVGPPRGPRAWRERDGHEGMGTQTARTTGTQSSQPR
ncbi:hypothetical protein AB1N83_014462 [Pleurotus pulmonarius]